MDEVNWLGVPKLWRALGGNCKRPSLSQRQDMADNGVSPNLVLVRESKVAHQIHSVQRDDGGVA